MKEWDNKFAPLARKIAAEVAAESGGEWDAQAIRRGEWDSTDEVIIAMRTLLALTDQAVIAEVADEGLLCGCCNVDAPVAREVIYAAIAKASAQ